MATESEKMIGNELDVKGDIVFDNVSFIYPTASRNALQNVNLSVQHGNIVALVGYSGAGKSTLVDLVAGFWYLHGRNDLYRRQRYQDTFTSFAEKPYRHCYPGHHALRRYCKGKHTLRPSGCNR